MWPGGTKLEKVLWKSNEVNLMAQQQNSQSDGAKVRTVSLMVQSRTGDPWEKNLDCQVSGHCYLEKAGLGIFS